MMLCVLLLRLHSRCRLDGQVAVSAANEPTATGKLGPESELAELSDRDSRK